MPRKGTFAPAGEERVLVLQGGGALGAYQAGVYEALEAAGEAPRWIAGISIGAINAALIAGNPPGRRLDRLREFWDMASSSCASWAGRPGAALRAAINDAAGFSALVLGVPGFFAPRFPPAPFHAPGTLAALSYYDTAPLRATLGRMVDFELLNDGPLRLSVGAVNVRTGNFAYFDTAERRLDVRHVMASGALPPGLPPVEIDGEWFWDGGLVSNTPLQYVLDQPGRAARLVYQVDLFPAAGPMPGTLAEAAEREKDIRYSSRTRLNTDNALARHRLARAARRLMAKLPEALVGDPDARALAEASREHAVAVVHVIYRRKPYETQSKDYEFSRLSMREHWRAGREDMARTLASSAWQNRQAPRSGVQIFDMTPVPTAERAEETA
ncbi:MAG TPA: patatin-like phospholipase family protein [Burkholderiales bacterium]|nr:patatin-like phospholipase family protein [Burkholderiales bacterium]